MLHPLLCDCGNLHPQANARKREAAEAHRKRELKKQYEESQKQEREDRLKELARLAEVQKIEDAKKEKQAEIDRAGVEERMQEMSFNFSWGAAPAWGAPAETPAVKEEPKKEEPKSEEPKKEELATQQVKVPKEKPAALDLTAATAEDGNDQRSISFRTSRESIVKDTPITPGKTFSLYCAPAGCLRLSLSLRSASHARQPPHHHS